MIFMITIISCKEQVSKNKKSYDIEEICKLHKIPIPTNGFNNGIVDKDGTLWFSSNGGGVYHFNGKSFKNYTIKDGLSSNQVFSIALDQDDNLWFGTQNGLTKYNRGKFEQIVLPFQDTSSLWLDKVYPIINPNAVYAITADVNNNLWIGTTGGGAYKYDGRTFKSYLTQIGRKQEDSLYHNWVSYLEKDDNKNIWFASMTGGGISQFDGKSFKHFLEKDGLSDNWVRCIYSDRSGKIWLGFNGNRRSGLTVYDGNSFKTFTVEDGLCHQQIRAIYEERDGNYWIGSDNGNLCIFDGQEFSNFVYDEQTFSSVHFIFNDFEDNIWFGGRNGIWKYNGQALIEITKQE